MVNVDVPAGVGAPPLDTQLPNPINKSLRATTHEAYVE